MKLFIDLNESVETLVENTEAGKKYFIEGKFLSANRPNRNGRVYPLAVMEGAVGKYQKDYIQQKRSLGELNHPNGPTINLDRVSHMIESLRFEGDDVFGRAKILNTPMGEIAKNLIDEGVKLGVSSRGLGSLKSVNGVNEVQKDFWISTVDIVSDPSGYGCFVNGLQESLDWDVLADGTVQQIVVDHAKKRIDESKAIKAFADFMLKISKNK